MTSSAAESVLRKALAELGITGEQFARMTERNDAGNLYRGEWAVSMRAMVWCAMRRKQKNGQQLSYPEIAAAFGERSHSTIIEAVRREERRGG